GNDPICLLRQSLSRTRRCHSQPRRVSLHVAQFGIVAFAVAQEANVSKSHRLQGFALGSTDTRAFRTPFLQREFGVRLARNLISESPQEARTIAAPCAAVHACEGCGFGGSKSLEHLTAILRVGVIVHRLTKRLAGPENV